MWSRAFNNEKGHRDRRIFRRVYGPVHYIKKLVGKPGQRRVEISQTDNFDFNPDMDRETGGLKNSKKHKSKKHKSKKRKSTKKI